MGRIYTEEFLSTRSCTQPLGRTEHVILVMILNRFPVVRPAVLFAHKHRKKNEVQSAVQFCQTLKAFIKRFKPFWGKEQQKPLERCSWTNLQGPKLRPETSKFFTSERRHVTIRVSKCIPFSSLTHFSSVAPFVMSLACSPSPQGGNFSRTPKQKKSHFKALMTYCSDRLMYKEGHCG